MDGGLLDRAFVAQPRESFRALVQRGFDVYEMKERTAGLQDDPQAPSGSAELNRHDESPQVSSD